jgi:hypothetical protein
MMARARDYLAAHRWCESIDAEYFGFGVGGVVAVCLFRVTLTGGDREWLWVVEGDVPSAYLVTDRAPTPSTALEVYVELDSRIRSLKDSIIPAAIEHERDKRDGHGQ